MRPSAAIGGRIFSPNEQQNNILFHTKYNGTFCFNLQLQSGPFCHLYLCLFLSLGRSVDSCLFGHTRLNRPTGQRAGTRKRTNTRTSQQCREIFTQTKRNTFQFSMQLAQRTQQKIRTANPMNDCVLCAGRICVEMHAGRTGNR